MSWEEFKDGYWYGNINCGSAPQCTGMDALRRIPRKIIQTADDGNHDVFWGIVARQQKSFAMVLLYTTMAGLPILPSIWFFFWWLNPGELTDEIQLASHREGCVAEAAGRGVVVGQGQQVVDELHVTCRGSRA